METYIKALKFAMEKHQHQKRTNGDPYILHPIRVAERLREVGIEAHHPVVIAALLHDTIEDCGVNRGTIEYHFGKEVADIVVGVTDDNRLARKERKEDMLERMKTASLEIVTLKLADRMDNLNDNPPYDERRLRKKIEETRRLLDIVAPDDWEDTTLPWKKDDFNVFQTFKQLWFDLDTSIYMEEEHLESS